MIKVARCGYPTAHGHVDCGAFFIRGTGPGDRRVTSAGCSAISTGVLRSVGIGISVFRCRCFCRRAWFQSRNRPLPGISDVSAAVARQVVGRPHGCWFEVRTNGWRNWAKVAHLFENDAACRFRTAGMCADIVFAIRESAPPCPIQVVCKKSRNRCVLPKRGCNQGDIATRVEFHSVVEARLLMTTCRLICSSEKKFPTFLKKRLTSGGCSAHTAAPLKALTQIVSVVLGPEP